MGEERPAAGPWYEGISRYQWLVLVLASLGWIFDVFEGQIFVASTHEALGGLLPPEARADEGFYVNITFGAFLLGGAVGGVLFGRLSDHLGRARTLAFTILTYSLCTLLSSQAQTWWHLAVFRFLVALGVGGEWAVATALVAEVFPLRARAWSLALFHASSVLGTFLAVAAGLFLVGNPAIGWRWAFAVGAVPALLVLWIRRSLRDPQRTGPSARALTPGAVARLFRGALRRHTLVGVGLAAVGLATFWGSHIHGKDRLRAQVEQAEIPADLPAAERAAQVQALEPALKRWEMAGMFLVTTGGGLGLVCFGPLTERLGRRGAFLFYHAGGVASSLVLFLVLTGVPAVLLFLPVFGFLTLGMHAGYAVYFPELFPTALRGAGAGFCFNVGRILAAPFLFLTGWLQRRDLAGLSLDQAAALVSLLFLVGLGLLLAAPETHGRELPD
jgi:MFS family permease